MDAAGTASGVKHIWAIRTCESFFVTAVLIKKGRI